MHEEEFKSKSNTVFNTGNCEKTNNGYIPSPHSNPAVRCTSSTVQVEASFLGRRRCSAALESRYSPFDLSLYSGAITSVKTSCSDAGKFTIHVGCTNNELS